MNVELSNDERERERAVAVGRRSVVARLRSSQVCASLKSTEAGAGLKTIGNALLYDLDADLRQD
jgi:hypothetical protein